MSRDKLFEVSGLNIRIHPEHNPSKYVDLWRAFYQTKGFVTHSNTSIMIGEMRRTEGEDPNRPVIGSFYKFLNIDTKEPWFDIEKRRKADQDDVEKIVIPDYLKPNLVEVPYIFLPDTHKLYFVSRDSSGHASPGMVLKLVQALRRSRKVMAQFETVEVDVITDMAKVEQFFSWKVLKTLNIYIKRPNPVDVDDEMEVLQRLRRRGAESERVLLKKARDVPSLTPDAEIRKLVRVAADNGEVAVTGKNEQMQVDRASSKAFPMFERGSYSPATQTLLGALMALVLDKFR